MSEISRFFRFEFFKRQGFPTKMDGIAFIEATPALKKEMAKLHMEIEEFKEEKIDEFEQRFEKYEKEKKMFLLNVKEKIRERKVSMFYMLSSKRVLDKIMYWILTPQKTNTTKDKQKRQTKQKNQ